ncbi:hypothetical protein V5O48_011742 [Marasmius crinis-equi]|uniref:Kinase-like protein n=1 Tax=Marasmius crinis-equi TaxID=585013 RepID=A0ABR3F4S5_9AGAR
MTMSIGIGRNELSENLQRELSNLEKVLGDQTKRETLIQMRGSEAQYTLDLLQLLVDLPDPIQSSRSRVFKIMTRLSKNSRRFPQCLVIRNIELFGKRPFGCGAFGDVWRGKVGDAAMGQVDCAVKVVRRAYFNLNQADEDDQDSDYKKILDNHVREAIIWRQLKHPNVLPFLGIYHLDNNREDVCLVSPYMTNGNLAQFLRKADPSQVDVPALVFDVASGLEYLHNEDVVHGDLKDLNILLTGAYRACICDFGLSRFGVTLGLPPSTYRGGTLGYMAPEVIYGGLSVKESDIYSIGTLCFTILRKVYDLPNDVPRGGGAHPRPINLPEDTDYLWSLVQDCWMQERSARPTAEDIVRRVTAVNDIIPASDWDQSLYSSIRNNIDLQPLLESASQLSQHQGMSQLPPPSVDFVVTSALGSVGGPVGDEGVQTLIVDIGNYYHFSPAYSGKNHHIWDFFVTPKRTDNIEEVHVLLHRTFAKNHIILRQPPYIVSRRGWDIFTIEARIILKPGYFWMSEDAADSPNGAPKGMLPLEWLLDFAQGGKKRYTLKLGKSTLQTRFP